MSKVVISHPHGNPFASNVANALHEADLLSVAFTTFAYRESGALHRVVTALPASLAKRVHAEFSRRAWLPDLAQTHLAATSYEFVRMMLARPRFLKACSRRMTDLVYQRFDARVAEALPADTGAVYSYEDGASKTFSAAHRIGARMIYDLPIVHYRTHQKILIDEQKAYPMLASSMTALHEPEEKLRRKDHELFLADRIVVPSNQVLRSLIDAGVQRELVSVIPFGAPVELLTLPRDLPDNHNFNVLFVGRIGVRKGVHYLLEAWADFTSPDSHLTLVGINEFPIGFPRSWPAQCSVFGSKPRKALTELYQRAHVVVIPSLVEGLPLVLLEALAAGCTVIASDMSGAEDLITHGKSGLIVPSRSSAKLTEALRWCREHPEQCAAIGAQGRRIAHEYSWTRYRSSILDVVRGELQRRDARGQW